MVGPFMNCSLTCAKAVYGFIGHAGAMLQARRLGKELYVGIHSDEAILENKGPTVMTLAERLVDQSVYRSYANCCPALLQCCRC